MPERPCPSFAPSSRVLAQISRRRAVGSAVHLVLIWVGIAACGVLVNNMTARGAFHAGVQSFGQLHAEARDFSGPVDRVVLHRCPAPNRWRRS
jgi:hypothetical protein